MPDKFKATWISHSSASDFLNCPKLYYYRAVYKDPVTRNKFTLMQPPLALGQVVHEVIEGLSVLPVEERFAVSPLKKFEIAWETVTGKMGGFRTKEQEEEYKERGRNMIKRVVDNPGPLLNKAIKIKEELPQYWLSEEEEIMLSGKIDWMEWIEETNSVHIIDFKTSRREEDPDSLQLPIYHLLSVNTQKRNVTKASYWYLEMEDKPKEVKLPDLAEAERKVMEVAKRMKLARQLGHFKCPQGDEGCKYCIPLERIAKGQGTKVGQSRYGQDIYILE